MDPNDILYHRPPSNPPYKKRNVDRACDACRRRKTKCDGSQMPNQRCTNCSQASRPCTYDEPSKPRGPPKAYITAVEDEVESLEALLKQLHPNGDYSKQLGPPVIRDSWKDDGDIQHPLWSNTLPTEIKVPLPLPSVLSPPDTDQDSSEDPGAILDVLELPIHGERMQKLKLRAHEEPIRNEPTHQAYARFHGKSSTVGLVGVTQMLKMMHLLNQGTKHDARLDAPDCTGSIPCSESPTFTSMYYRPKFWKMPERERQWEERNMNTRDLIAQLLSAFPPVDLIPELMRVYFVHSNCPLPLLHRPTFERQWKENLHHTNVWFAAVCLGVFAIASRWSSDTRVVPDGATTPSGNPDWSLAGWKYCKAGIGLLEVRRRLFCPTTLFELQSFSLFSTYLRDSGHRPLTWVLVGCAIRKAQDAGVHRSRVHGREPTAESELWKRVFWCLVIVDRFESAVTGRPALVGEEDFDVDLPLEVDDEYWEANDSGATFQQPKDVPANKIISFNQIIKLSRNLAFALKTFYAADKQRIHSGLSPSGWRRAILEHVSAGLQGWYKAVPEHLRWSNQSDSSPYKVDTAVLQTTYLLIQMLVHQMFIPNPITSSASSEFTNQSPHLPSPLDICVNAAHDCANISHSQNLIALSTWPIYIYASQVASTILLIKIWNVKMQEKVMHARGVEDVKPPMLTLEPLYKSLKIFSNILDMSESRWGFMAPYLEELKRTLPVDLLDEIPLTDVANKGNMDCPELHPGSGAPSYPSLVQPSPQEPFSANSLPQSALSHQPSQRSQKRLSYSPPHNSESPYSLQRAAQHAQPLSFNEIPSAQHLRAEGRNPHDLPSIDYLPPTEYRPRQHSTDVPLVTKLTDEVVAPYNSNHRKFDDDLALPSPYDRSKPSPSDDALQTLPSFPRTLHPVRSLPYMRNPVPFTSHDSNAHRVREGLKIDIGRHSDSPGTGGSLSRPSQNIDTIFLGHSYPLKANAFSTKQDRRHSSQLERVNAPNDWPANPSKSCTRPVLDTDILSHRSFV